MKAAEAAERPRILLSRSVRAHLGGLCRATPKALGGFHEFPGKVFGVQAGRWTLVGLRLFVPDAEVSAVHFRVDARAMHALGSKVAQECPWARPLVDLHPHPGLGAPRPSGVDEREWEDAVLAYAPIVARDEVHARRISGEWTEGGVRFPLGAGREVLVSGWTEPEGAATPAITWREREIRALRGVVITNSAGDLGRAYSELVEVAFDPCGSGRILRKARRPCALRVIPDEAAAALSGLPLDAVRYETDLDTLADDLSRRLVPVHGLPRPWWTPRESFPTVRRGQPSTDASGTTRDPLAAAASRLFDSLVVLGSLGHRPQREGREPWLRPSEATLWDVARVLADAKEAVEGVALGREGAP